MDGGAAVDVAAAAVAQAKRERNKLRHERNKEWRGYLQSLSASLREAASDDAEPPAPGAVREPSKMRNAKEVRAQKSSLPLSQRCCFFLERKGRTCSRARLEGSSFCVTHQAATAAAAVAPAATPSARGSAAAAASSSSSAGTRTGGADGAGASEAQALKRRVQCMHCGSTMWEGRASRHAARCNAAKQRRSQRALSCWAAGFNSGPPPPAPPPTEDVRPHEPARRPQAESGGSEQGPLPLLPEQAAAAAAAEPAEEDSIWELRRRVDAAYERWCGAHVGEGDAIVREVMVARGPDELGELAASRSSTAGDTVTQKHLSQQSSILGHMQSHGLLLGGDSSSRRQQHDRGWAPPQPVAAAAGAACRQAAPSMAATALGATAAGSRPPDSPGAGYPPPTFVEFGAGKGMMSLGVSGHQPDADLLLVEREGGVMRTKADRVLRMRSAAAAAAAAAPGAAGEGGGGGHRFERICIDIRDLDLSKYTYGGGTPPPPSPPPPHRAPGPVSGCLFDRPVVAVSKHLCGVATDLTLRCLVHYERSVAAARAAAAAAAACSDQHDRGGHSCSSSSGREGSPPPPPVVRGLAIALCCHGLCRWEDYVGQGWWTERLGFSARDFERAKRFGSWATGARKKVMEMQQQPPPPPPPQAQAHGINGPPPPAAADAGRQLQWEPGVLPWESAAAPPEPSSQPSQPPASEAGPWTTEVAATATAVEAEHQGSQQQRGWHPGSAGETEPEPSERPPRRPRRLMEPAEMVAFGRRCKRLIDAGRLHFVRESLPHLTHAQGGCTKLTYYCDESVSPENCLLIGAAAAAAASTSCA